MKLMRNWLRRTDKFDKLGIFISSLCAIHCLVTPLFVFILPTLGMSLHHPLFHWTIALLVIPLGVFAFWQGYKHHHHLSVLITGILGISIVGLAALLPHSWIHFFGHDVVTIIGSIFLITAHYLNRRACRHCRH